MTKRDPSSTPLENAPFAKRPKDQNLDGGTHSDAPTVSQGVLDETENCAPESDQAKMQRLEPELANQKTLAHRERAAKSYCLEQLDGTRTSNAITLADIHAEHKDQLIELIGAQEKMQQQIRDLQRDINKMRLELVERRSSLQLADDDKRSHEHLTTSNEHTVKDLRARLEATEQAHDVLEMNTHEKGWNPDIE
ncbi:hypothetical protein CC86DRAFT_410374 [Ophiobolus disseminans]|uniref:Uncharacterized protein n=1 Tax=Ophiobolus disseminans TaxID=1469910 RepID=A0A6A6ZLP8_9PLEO|nr:hypothetical protein CC86DRAFT_410374 [Ophiobolus disseminans]